MSKRYARLVLAVVLAFALAVGPAASAKTPDCSEPGCAHVAAIGTTHYDTVAEALADVPASASEPATVQLLKPTNESITIATGKSVVLDLNGQKLTDNGVDHTITNNGTLVIQGSGTVDCETHARGALVNYGTCTISGGTLTRSQEAGTEGNANGNSWYVVDNHGMLTVTGGKIFNTSTYSSLLRNLGTLNVNGGEFENGGIVIKNDEDSGNSKIGVLNMTAGTVKATSTNGQAVQNWATATIQGGTLTGQVIGWSYEGVSSTLTIKDGAINGNLFAVDFDGKGTDTASVKVEGGTVTGMVNTGAYSNGAIQVGAESNSSISLTGGVFTHSVDVFRSGLAEFRDPGKVLISLKGGTGIRVGDESSAAASVYFRRGDFIPDGFVAYYESLQDALDGAGKEADPETNYEGVVTALKTPEDGTVVVPDGAVLTVGDQEYGAGSYVVKSGALQKQEPVSETPATSTGRPNPSTGVRF